MILTVGHSTRPLAELIGLLREHRVSTVADVRKIRGSRAFPQFNERRLANALRKAAIDYLAIPELAGRRPKAASPSPRPCWQNRGFRNYADHMRTDEFREGIRKLLAIRGTVAVMCAEAVPWRCHRSLIGDYLTVEKKRKVQDLVGDRAQPHRKTVCARVVRGRLTYDLS